MQAKQLTMQLILLPVILSNSKTLKPLTKNSRKESFRLWLSSARLRCSISWSTNTRSTISIRISNNSNSNSNRMFKISTRCKQLPSKRTITFSRCSYRCFSTSSRIRVKLASLQNSSCKLLEDSSRTSKIMLLRYNNNSLSLFQISKTSRINNLILHPRMQRPPPLSWSNSSLRTRTIPRPSGHLHQTPPILQPLWFPNQLRPNSNFSNKCSSRIRHNPNSSRVSSWPSSLRVTKPT